MNDIWHMRQALKEARRRDRYMGRARTYQAINLKMYAATIHTCVRHARVFNRYVVWHLQQARKFEQPLPAPTSPRNSPPPRVREPATGFEVSV
jgi:hypothetical protein